MPRAPKNVAVDLHVEAKRLQSQAAPDVPLALTELEPEHRRAVGREATAQSALPSNSHLA